MTKMKGLISFVGLKFEFPEKKDSIIQMEMKQREQRWMYKKGQGFAI